MQIRPIHAFTRITSLVARRYQDQIRRENEVTLAQRFAALDHGLAPPTVSVFGGGLQITAVPDRDDPLEQLWRLPAGREAKIDSELHDLPLGSMIVSGSTTTRSDSREAEHTALGKLTTHSCPPALPAPS